MVVRVVLVVLATTALLAVGIPAAESAQSEHAARLVHDELATLRDTAAQFQRRNDATPPGLDGPTSIYVIRVPERATVRLGVGPRNESLTWTTDATRGRIETDLPIARPLTLHGGTHRIQFRLCQTPEGPALRLHRLKPEATTTG